MVTFVKHFGVLRRIPLLLRRKSMFVGSAFQLGSFTVKTLLSSRNLPLNSFYAEIKSTINLALFRRWIKIWSFSSVQRSAVEPELNAVFFLFFSYPVTEILPNMLCNTYSREPHRTTKQEKEEKQERKIQESSRRDIPGWSPIFKWSPIFRI